MGDEDGAHHVPSSTNLFIGNLAPDIGTDALREMFEPFGDIESCTVMMDANTRTSRGFGFVKYRTPEHAGYAIQCMNNATSKDGVKMLVKFANASEEELNYPTNNLFVKGLPVTINSESVQALFSPYGTITETRILTDAISHQSRGQALVRFTDVDSAQRAIDALHGYKFPGTAKGITVKFADSDQAKQDRRKRVERKMMAASRYSPYAPPPYQAPTSYAQYHQYYASMHDHQPPPSYYPPPQHHHSHHNSHHNSHHSHHSHHQPHHHQSHHHHQPPSPTPPPAPAGQDPNNLYIYHLPPDADDALLYRLFAPFGAIHSVKIGRDPNTGACKGFGFVRMVHHNDAWNAVNSVNGTKVGNKTLSVTFKK